MKRQLLCQQCAVRTATFNPAAQVTALDAAMAAQERVIRKYGRSRGWYPCDLCEGTIGYDERVTAETILTTDETYHPWEDSYINIEPMSENKPSDLPSFVGDAVRAEILRQERMLPAAATDNDRARFIRDRLLEALDNWPDTAELNEAWKRVRAADDEIRVWIKQQRADRERDLQISKKQ